MADSLTVEVVTLARAVFSGAGSEVIFTADRGELGVLPGHLPLMTRVVPGELRIKREGGVETFAIGGGFAEVANDRVTLLVTAAEGMDTIDIERARRALEESTRHINEHGLTADPETREQAERRLRALARIKVAERATGGK